MLWWSSLWLKEDCCRQSAMTMRMFTWPLLNQTMSHSPCYGMKLGFYTSCQYSHSATLHWLLPVQWIMVGNGPTPIRFPWHHSSVALSYETVPLRGNSHYKVRRSSLRSVTGSFLIYNYLSGKSYKKKVKL